MFAVFPFLDFLAVLSKKVFGLMNTLSVIVGHVEHENLLLKHVCEFCL